MYAVKRRTIIGRGRECEVWINDSAISRQHVRIDVGDDNQFVLSDLGSRNGTRVNGERVTTRSLVDGDRIEVGASSLLKLVVQDELDLRFQDAQRMEALGRLAGGIAHEFNNLLTVILNNLAHMETVMARFNEPDLVECIHDSLLEARRGAQLTRNLLGYARHGNFDAKRVELSDLAASFVRLINRTLSADIKIVTDIEPGLVIQGDANRLHQVLLNLGLNARDAMPDGGTLTVSVGHVNIAADDETCARGVPAGSWVRMAVSDSGQGMDDDTRARIFEPFFSTKKDGSGSGLGLAVADGIVRLHGGHILVDSAPGKGSTFAIFIPPLDENLPAESPVAVAAETRVAPQRGRRVLVVDDEEPVRKSIARLLESARFDTVETSDGEAAIAAFEREHARIGLVLLDLTMPRMDGEVVFRRMHAIDPHVPVVLCTGRIDEDTATRLRAQGVVDILLKPFDRIQLIELVSRFVNG
jgi:signal transduction histidine kinase